MSNPAGNAAPNSPWIKRVVFVAFALAAAALAGHALWHAWRFETTDNAYVDGHVARVAPRIDGVVARIHVRDNQIVREGEPLFDLDDADRQAGRERAQAALERQDQEILRRRSEHAQAQAELEVARAALARARAQRRRAETEASRATALRAEDRRSVSASEFESALAARDGARADAQARQHEIAAAQARVEAAAATLAAAQAQRKVLAAEERESGLGLGYTHVLAPVGGRIGRKSIELGVHLKAGQEALAIVQAQKWIDANFKETQLADLFVGQRANIRIDAFPEAKVEGRIESFAPASGATFALLPPDNATGNFTRVVQRVAVRIALDPDSLRQLGDRLAPGMSAMVEVDLGQHAPARP